jgi:SNF2 family DNA or RNA helicase
MGMGKTIQTIATIMDNMPKLQHSMPKAKHITAEREVRQREDAMWENARLEWDHEMKMINAPKSVFPKFSEKAPGGGFRAGTLIICPVIALSQWKSEIEKFTEAGKLTVGTYHGSDRAKEMPRMLMRTYDIVLTTYQVSLFIIVHDRVFLYLFLQLLSMYRF